MVCIHIAIEAYKKMKKEEHRERERSQGIGIGGELRGRLSTKYDAWMRSDNRMIAGLTILDKSASSGTAV